ncbi:hypothetical protein Smp_139590 [Schistosoma mansoni]|uniref:Prophage protein n=1 Tax=Schistosoma mansoni TaxID=6183 RepID=G4LYN0_SCHMA|nr:hypothetical protein Smp_139590 [Schistosoma mansoni]|eukprot:XP_018646364.1 hypothetical protein Smp_139590 [Schistosoma mansoni]
MRQIKKSAHSNYTMGRQSAQRYAEEIYFCSRLQDSMMANTTKKTVRSDPAKQVTEHKDAKMSSFKPGNTQSAWICNRCKGK